jgi:DNA-binding GntR family transcriptional regulator
MARAADQAYDIIRAAIVEGEFAPGERLPEEDLAERAKVSRTPVREALRRLANEGVVEFVANRGAQVAQWSKQDLQELFDLRAVLEGYAARLAAANASDDDIARLSLLADQMEALAQDPTAENLERIAELNNTFHADLIEVAGNRLLAQQVSGLVQMPLVHRTFHNYDADGLARSMAHHRELLVALAHHDVNWAGTVMRSHIYAGRASLQRTLPGH